MSHARIHGGALRPDGDRSVVAGLLRHVLWLLAGSVVGAVLLWLGAALFAPTAAHAVGTGAGSIVLTDQASDQADALKQLASLSPADQATLREVAKDPQKTADLKAYAAAHPQPQGTVTPAAAKELNKLTPAEQDQLKTMQATDPAAAKKLADYAAQHPQEVQQHVAQTQQDAQALKSLSPDQIKDLQKLSPQQGDALKKLPGAAANCSSWSGSQVCSSRVVSNDGTQSLQTCAAGQKCSGTQAQGTGGEKASCSMGKQTSCAASLPAQQSGNPKADSCASKGKGAAGCTVRREGAGDGSHNTRTTCTQQCIAQNSRGDVAGTGSGKAEIVTPQSQDKPTKVTCTGTNCGIATHDGDRVSATQTSGTSVTTRDGDDGKIKCTQNCQATSREGRTLEVTNGQGELKLPNTGDATGSASCTASGPGGNCHSSEASTAPGGPRNEVSCRSDQGCQTHQVFGDGKGKAPAADCGTTQNGECKFNVTETSAAQQTTAVRGACSGPCTANGSADSATAQFDCHTDAGTCDDITRGAATHPALTGAGTEQASTVSHCQAADYGCGVHTSVSVGNGGTAQTQITCDDGGVQCTGRGTTTTTAATQNALAHRQSSGGAICESTNGSCGAQATSTGAASTAVVQAKRGSGINGTAGTISGDVRGARETTGAGTCSAQGEGTCDANSTTSLGSVATSTADATMKCPGDTQDCGGKTHATTSGLDTAEYLYRREASTGTDCAAKHGACGGESTSSASSGPEYGPADQKTGPSSIARSYASLKCPNGCMGEAHSSGSGVDYGVAGGKPRGSTGSTACAVATGDCGGTTTSVASGAPGATDILAAQTLPGPQPRTTPAPAGPSSASMATASVRCTTVCNGTATSGATGGDGVSVRGSNADVGCAMTGGSCAGASRSVASAADDVTALLPQVPPDAKVTPAGKPAAGPSSLSDAIAVADCAGPCTGGVRAVTRGSDGPDATLTKALQTHGPPSTSESGTTSTCVAGAAQCQALATADSATGTGVAYLLDPRATNALASIREVQPTAPPTGSQTDHWQQSSQQSRPQQPDLAQANTPLPVTISQSSGYTACGGPDCAGSVLTRSATTGKGDAAASLSLGSGTCNGTASGCLTSASGIASTAADAGQDPNKPGATVPGVTGTTQANASVECPAGCAGKVTSDTIAGASPDGGVGAVIDAAFHPDAPLTRNGRASDPTTVSLGHSEAACSSGPCQAGVATMGSASSSAAARGQNSFGTTSALATGACETGGNACRVGTRSTTVSSDNPATIPAALAARAVPALPFTAQAVGVSDCLFTNCQSSSGGFATANTAQANAGCAGIGCTAHSDGVAVFGGNTARSESACTSPGLGACATSSTAGAAENVAQVAASCQGTPGTGCLYRYRASSSASAPGASANAAGHGEGTFGGGQVMTTAMAAGSPGSAQASAGCQGSAGTSCSHHWSVHASAHASDPSGSYADANVSDSGGGGMGQSGGWVSAVATAGPGSADAGIACSNPSSCKGSREAHAAVGPMTTPFGTFTVDRWATCKGGGAGECGAWVKVDTASKTAGAGCTGDGACTQGGNSTIAFTPASGLTVGPAGLVVDAAGNPVGISELGPDQEGVTVEPGTNGEVKITIKAKGAAGPRTFTCKAAPCEQTVDAVTGGNDAGKHNPDGDYYASMPVAGGDPNSRHEVRGTDGVGLAQDAQGNATAWVRGHGMAIDGRSGNKIAFTRASAPQRDVNMSQFGVNNIRFQNIAGSPFTSTCNGGCLWTSPTGENLTVDGARGTIQAQDANGNPARIDFVGGGEFTNAQHDIVHADSLGPGVGVTDIVGRSRAGAPASYSVTGTTGYIQFDAPGYTGPAGTGAYKIQIKRGAPAPDGISSMATLPSLPGLSGAGVPIGDGIKATTPDAQGKGGTLWCHGDCTRTLPGQTAVPKNFVELAGFDPVTSCKNCELTEQLATGQGRFPNGYGTVELFDHSNGVVTRTTPQGDVQSCQGMGCAFTQFNRGPDGQGGGAVCSVAAGEAGTCAGRDHTGQFWVSGTALAGKDGIRTGLLYGNADGTYTGRYCAGGTCLGGGPNEMRVPATTDAMAAVVDPNIQISSGLAAELAGLKSDYGKPVLDRKPGDRNPLSQTEVEMLRQAGFGGEVDKQAGDIGALSRIQVDGAQMAFLDDTARNRDSAALYQKYKPQLDQLTALTTAATADGTIDPAEKAAIDRVRTGISDPVAELLQNWAPAQDELQKLTFAIWTGHDVTAANQAAGQAIFNDRPLMTKLVPGYDPAKALDDRQKGVAIDAITNLQMTYGNATLAQNSAVNGRIEALDKRIAAYNAVADRSQTPGGVTPAEAQWLPGEYSAITAEQKAIQDASKPLDANADSTLKTLRGVDLAYADASLNPGWAASLRGAFDDANAVTGVLRHLQGSAQPYQHDLATTFDTVKGLTDLRYNAVRDLPLASPVNYKPGATLAPNQALTGGMVLPSSLLRDSQSVQTSARTQAAWDTYQGPLTDYIHAAYPSADSRAAVAGYGVKPDDLVRPQAIAFNADSIAQQLGGADNPNSGQEAKKVMDGINGMRKDGTAVDVLTLPYYKPGTDNNPQGQWSTLPLFRVQQKDGSYRYVDPTGAHYSGLKDFRNNNELLTEDTKLVAPRDLNGGEVINTSGRHVSGWDKVKGYVVGGAMVVGGALLTAGGGLATIATLGAAAPLSAAAAVGGATLILGGIGYTSFDAGRNIHERSAHGQSNSWSNPAARADYLGLIGNGVALTGIGVGFTGAVRGAAAVTTDAADAAAAAGAEMSTPSWATTWRAAAKGSGAGFRTWGEASTLARTATVVDYSALGMYTGMAGYDTASYFHNWGDLTPAEKSQATAGLAQSWGMLAVPMAVNAGVSGLAGGRPLGMRGAQPGHAGVLRVGGDPATPGEPTGNPAADARSGGSRTDGDTAGGLRARRNPISTAVSGISARPADAVAGNAPRVVDALNPAAVRVGVGKGGVRQIQVAARDAHVDPAALMADARDAVRGAGRRTAIDLAARPDNGKPGRTPTATDGRTAGPLARLQVRRGPLGRAVAGAAGRFAGTVETAAPRLARSLDEAAIRATTGRSGLDAARTAAGKLGVDGLGRLNRRTGDQAVQAAAESGNWEAFDEALANRRTIDRARGVRPRLVRVNGTTVGRDAPARAASRARVTNAVQARDDLLAALNGPDPDPGLLGTYVDGPRRAGAAQPRPTYRGAEVAPIVRGEDGRYRFAEPEQRTVEPLGSETATPNPNATEAATPSGWTPRGDPQRARPNRSLGSRVKDVPRSAARGVLLAVTAAHVLGAPVAVDMATAERPAPVVRQGTVDTLGHTIENVSSGTTAGAERAPAARPDAAEPITTLPTADVTRPETPVAPTHEPAGPAPTRPADTPPGLGTTQPGRAPAGSVPTRAGANTPAGPASPGAATVPAQLLPGGPTPPPLLAAAVPIGAMSAPGNQTPDGPLGHSALLTMLLQQPVRAERPGTATGALKLPGMRILAIAQGRRLKQQLQATADELRDVLRTIDDSADPHALGTLEQEYRSVALADPKAYVWARMATDAPMARNWRAFQALAGAGAPQEAIDYLAAQTPAGLADELGPLLRIGQQRVATAARALQKYAADRGLEWGKADRGKLARALRAIAAEHPPVPAPAADTPAATPQSRPWVAALQAAGVSTGSTLAGLAGRLTHTPPTLTVAGAGAVGLAGAALWHRLRPAGQDGTGTSGAIPGTSPRDGPHTPDGQRADAVQPGAPVRPIGTENGDDSRAPPSTHDNGAVIATVNGGPGPAQSGSGRTTPPGPAPADDGGNRPTPARADDHLAPTPGRPGAATEGTQAPGGDRAVPAAGGTRFAAPLPAQPVTAQPDTARHGGDAANWLPVFRVPAADRPGTAPSGAGDTNGSGPAQPAEGNPGAATEMPDTATGGSATPGAAGRGATTHRTQTRADHGQEASVPGTLPARDTGGPSAGGATAPVLGGAGLLALLPAAHASTALAVLAGIAVPAATAPTMLRHLLGARGPPSIRTLPRRVLRVLAGTTMALAAATIFVAAPAIATSTSPAAATTTAPGTATTPAPGRTILVVPGESRDDLAKALGVDVNALSETGDGRLGVPVSWDGGWTLRPGDTLWEIAVRFGLDHWTELGITVDPQDLQPGTRLHTGLQRPASPAPTKAPHNPETPGTPATRHSPAGALAAPALAALVAPIALGIWMGWPAGAGAAVIEAGLAAAGVAVWLNRAKPQNPSEQAGWNRIPPAALGLGGFLPFAHSMNGLVLIGGVIIATGVLALGKWATVRQHRARIAPSVRSLAPGSVIPWDHVARSPQENRATRRAIRLDPALVGDGVYLGRLPANTDASTTLNSLLRGLTASAAGQYPALLELASNRDALAARLWEIGLTTGNPSLWLAGWIVARSGLPSAEIALDLAGPVLAGGASAIGLARPDVVRWFRIRQSKPNLNLARIADTHGHTSAEMISALERAANALLTRSGTGTPPVTIVPDPDLLEDAYFDAETWTILVNLTKLAGLEKLLLALIHEIRHAEQFHLMNRFARGELAPGTPEHTAAARWYELIYGAESEYRLRVLEALNAALTAHREVANRYHGGRATRDELARAIAEVKAAHEPYAQFAHEADARRVSDLYDAAGVAAPLGTGPTPARLPATRPATGWAEWRAAIRALDPAADRAEQAIAEKIAYYRNRLAALAERVPTVGNEIVDGLTRGAGAYLESDNQLSTVLPRALGRVAGLLRQAVDEDVRQTRSNQAETPTVSEAALSVSIDERELDRLVDEVENAVGALDGLVLILQHPELVGRDDVLSVPGRAIRAVTDAQYPARRILTLLDRLEDAREALVPVDPGEVRNRVVSLVLSAPGMATVNALRKDPLSGPARDVLAAIVDVLGDHDDPALTALTRDLAAILGPPANDDQATSTDNPAGATDNATDPESRRGPPADSGSMTAGPAVALGAVALVGSSILLAMTGHPVLTGAMLAIGGIAALARVLTSKPATALRTHTGKLARRLVLAIATTAVLLVPAAAVFAPAPAAAVAGAPAPPVTVVHRAQAVVQPGDTLSALAARHGTTVDALAAANPGRFPNADSQNLIFPNERLVLPNAKAVVQPGDTLSVLAARHGTTVDALAAANPGRFPNADSENTIYAGEDLTLPATATVTVNNPPGTPTTPTTPATPTTPVNPTTPSTTTGPETPRTPTTATAPAAPTTPATPGSPATITTSAAPATPAIPATPHIPATQAPGPAVPTGAPTHTAPGTRTPPAHGTPWRWWGLEVTAGGITVAVGLGTLVLRRRGLGGFARQMRAAGQGPLAEAYEAWIRARAATVEAQGEYDAVMASVRWLVDDAEAAIVGRSANRGHRSKGARRAPQAMPDQEQSPRERAVTVVARGLSKYLAVEQVRALAADVEGTRDAPLTGEEPWILYVPLDRAILLMARAFQRTADAVREATTAEAYAERAWQAAKVKAVTDAADAAGLALAEAEIDRLVAGNSHNSGNSGAATPKAAAPAAATPAAETRPGEAPAEAAPAATPADAAPADATPADGSSAAAGPAGASGADPAGPAATDPAAATEPAESGEVVAGSRGPARRLPARSQGRPRAPPREKQPTPRKNLLAAVAANRAPRDEALATLEQATAGQRQARAAVPVDNRDQRPLSELDAATDALLAARVAAERANRVYRRAVGDAVREAGRAGMSNETIARLTALTRLEVARITRAYEAEPGDREPFIDVALIPALARVSTWVARLRGRDLGTQLAGDLSEIDLDRLTLEQVQQRLWWLGVPVRLSESVGSPRRALGRTIDVHLHHIGYSDDRFAMIQTLLTWLARGGHLGMVWLSPIPQRGKAPAAGGGFFYYLVIGVLQQGVLFGKRLLWMRGTGPDVRLQRAVANLPRNLRWRVQPGISGQRMDIPGARDYLKTFAVLYPRRAALLAETTLAKEAVQLLLGVQGAYAINRDYERYLRILIAAAGEIKKALAAGRLTGDHVLEHAPGLAELLLTPDQADRSSLLPIFQANPEELRTLLTRIGEPAMAASLTTPAPRMYNRNLEEVFEALAETGQVIILHNDAGKARLDANGRYVEATPDGRSLLPVLAVLADPRFANVKIIYAHALGLGKFSTASKEHFDWLDWVLANYPQISVDISWNEIARHIMATDELKAQFLALVRKYPNRFMFGSDAVKPASLAHYLRHNTDLEPLFNELPHEIVAMVTETNAARLLHKATEDLAQAAFNSIKSGSWDEVLARVPARRAAGGRWVADEERAGRRGTGPGFAPDAMADRAGRREWERNPQVAELLSWVNLVTDDVVANKGDPLRLTRYRLRMALGETRDDFRAYLAELRSRWRDRDALHPADTLDTLGIPVTTATLIAAEQADQVGARNRNPVPPHLLEAVWTNVEAAERSQFDAAKGMRRLLQRLHARDLRGWAVVLAVNAGLITSLIMFSSSLPTTAFGITASLAFLIRGVLGQIRSVHLTQARVFQETLLERGRLDIRIIRWQRYLLLKQVRRELGNYETEKLDQIRTILDELVATAEALRYIPLSANETTFDRVQLFVAEYSKASDRMNSIAGANVTGLAKLGPHSGVAGIFLHTVIALTWEANLIAHLHGAIAAAAGSLAWFTAGSYLVADIAFLIATLPTAINGWSGYDSSANPLYRRLQHLLGFPVVTIANALLAAEMGLASLATPSPHNIVGLAAAIVLTAATYGLSKQGLAIELSLGRQATRRGVVLNAMVGASLASFGLIGLSTAPWAIALAVVMPAIAVLSNDTTRKLPKLKASVGGTFHALSNANFRKFFVGSLVSNLFTITALTSQELLMLDLTHNNGGALGFVIAAQFGAQLLTTVIAGWLADRVNPRRLMIWSQAGAGAAMVVQGLLVVTGLVVPWHIIALGVFSGIFTALGGPVQSTYTRRLVGKTGLANATSLMSMNLNLARVGGPLVGALLYTTVGPGMVFLVNAASYAAVIWTLLRIDDSKLHPVEHKPSQGGPIAQLGEGVRYLHSRPAMITMLGTMSTVLGLGATFLITMPIVTRLAFHRPDAASYGVLNTMLSIGSVIGSTVAARRSQNLRVKHIAIAGIALGLLDIALGLAPGYGSFAALLIPAGVALMSFSPAINSKVSLSASDGLRGRVMSVYLLLLLGGNMLDGFLIPWLAHEFGPQSPLLIGGVVTAIVATATAPALLRHERIPTAVSEWIADTITGARALGRGRQQGDGQDGTRR